MIVQENCGGAYFRQKIKNNDYTGLSSYYTILDSNYGPNLYTKGVIMNTVPEKSGIAVTRFHD